MPFEVSLFDRRDHPERQKRHRNGHQAAARTIWPERGGGPEWSADLELRRPRGARSNARGNQCVSEGFEQLPPVQGKRMDVGIGLAIGWTERASGGVSYKCRSGGGAALQHLDAFFADSLDYLPQLFDARRQPREFFVGYAV